MYTIKRGDTGIGIKATLSNDCGVVDLTEASVLFLFGRHSITPDILDATKGELVVALGREHTQDLGYVKAEFEVVYSDGKVETYPNDSYINFNIIRDLGGVS